MRKLLCFVLILYASQTVFGQSGIIKYSVPKDPWSEYFGNHRAVIKVDKSSDAVLIDFLWRRHDISPDKRGMFIVNAKSGKEIKNIFRINIDNERCNLVFGPVDTAGLYYFYYLPSASPSTAGTSKGRVARNYMSVENAPDSLWVLDHQLTGGTLKYQNVVKATITEIQARTEFDSFYPMEVIATKNETNIFLNQHKDDYLVFPEDRTLPIRMLDAIPFRWTQKLPGGDFSGKAKKNEYYALQLGVFASQMPLQNIKLEFSDLRDKNGNIIPRKAFTCYNTDGVDINGNPFTIRVDVKQGIVQPLWIGVDIPPDAKSGIYESVIGVKPDNLKEQKVKIVLTIENDYLTDRGDSEPWRHSKLRWLNSTLGIDDEPVAPYVSLVVNNQKISCLGRSVQLNSYGFPEVIDSWGNNILATSVKFIIQVNNQAVTFPAGKFSYKLQKNGIVAWESIADNNDFTLICKGEMEFDGRLSYKCELKSKSSIHIQDIRLELPLKKEFATYMIGMGRSGGFTPKNHISMWSQTEDSFWIGETKGGIQCQLRGSTYHVPRSYGEPFLTLFQLDPPSTWFNDRNGGFRIDSYDSTVTASAFSGMRNMVNGQSVNYEFALLITPVKKLDYKSQFTNRYFHATEPTPEVLANGGNVMNVHHANQYNPYINYPFIAQKEMRGLVDKWHAKGWKVKIYYTVRELSNRTPELWALRSLGTEVLADGNSGGDRWLREHLVNNYGPAWYAYLGNGESDQAIMSSFISDKSRWYNYYVEGLNWLVKNMDIDGLYLDDVTFDRRILKRMRKVMEMNKPGCMIDLHSHTGFSRGAVNHYLEFFPYIDKTWFGEGFNFDIQPADFWLTETSGIPFGIMNDLLMGRWSVNTHRGMNFGMTVRGFTPMWKLWDDFGITDSKMAGYWETNPVVTLDHKNVFATAYIKDGKALISIGSWVGEPVNVKMNIDWKRLGLNPLEVNIIAPEIKDYQKERLFKVDEPIPIDPNSDCLLIISKK